MLDKANMKTSKLHLYNGLCIVLFWAIFRIGYVFYSTALFFKERNYLIYETPLGYCLFLIFQYLLANGLNTFWFIKIVKGAAKLLLGGGAKKQ